MFSKYDVYTTVQSMYCYPDTDVLINKLDIRDKAEHNQPFFAYFARSSFTTC